MHDSKSNASDGDESDMDTSGSHVSDGEDSKSNASDGDNTDMGEDSKDLILQDAASKRVRASLDSIGHEIDDCIMKLVEDDADLCDAYDQTCVEYADKYNKNY